MVEATPQTVSTTEEFNELTARLIKCLEKSGLDYAITGAIAVSFYGAPRTTSDVDVMVALRAGGVDMPKILNALNCAGIQVDKKRIEDAIQSGYNIATFQDKSSPYSVDLILSSGELDKRPGRVAGMDTYIQQPEGLVLAKLRMIKATIPRERAMKDEEDVRAILRFSKINLDVIKRRAMQEKTLDILNDLMNSIDY
jgi:hypothetical protein